MSPLNDAGHFAEVATRGGVKDAYLVPGFTWVIHKRASAWYLKDPSNWRAVRWVHNYLDKERLEAKMREAEVKYMMGE